MAHHQRASIRLLALILTALNIASIAALPQHHHPCPSHDALVARDALADGVPVILNSKSDPNAFFQDLVDFLGQYSARDLLWMLFGKLLKVDDSPASTIDVPSVTPVEVTGVDLKGESTTIDLPISSIFVMPTPSASVSLEASVSASAQAEVSASVTIPVSPISTIPASFSASAIPTDLSASSHPRLPIVSWIDELISDVFGPDPSTTIVTLTSFVDSTPTASLETTFPSLTSWDQSFVLATAGATAPCYLQMLSTRSFPLTANSDGLVLRVIPTDLECPPKVTDAGIESPVITSIPLVTAPTIPDSVVSEISGLPESNETTSEIIFSILPWPPFETPRYPNVTVPSAITGLSGAAGTLVIPTSFATSRRNTTQKGIWPPIRTSFPRLNTTLRIKSTRFLTVTATVVPVPPSLVSGPSGISVAIPSTTGVVRWPNTTFSIPAGPTAASLDLNATVSVPTYAPTISSPAIDVIIPTGTLATISSIESVQLLDLNITIPISPPVSTISLPEPLTIPSSTPSLSISTSLPILIPLPTPYINASDTTPYAGRLPLREVCSSTTAKTITLPLLDLFYGSYAYPSLKSFPGCTAPNPSQELHAPGLLNCTDLGQEVLACQRLGRRVLLSVKGSSVGEVGGNTNYGKPGVSDYPFGAYFPHGGVNGSASANTEATVTAERSPHPNLFDERHPPSALALTLFSLFGEGDTERADLRPLGDEDPYVSNPDARWFVKPLGEEVVVDGFDVQVPAEWKGTYQGDRFGEFTKRLRELVDDAWKGIGGDRAEGGPEDLGSDGKGEVLSGWV